ncbi:hypothetical protein EDB86DRAFT_2832103 [Lactarius hatsudake]|nr:hypothetical protein EDB86DRAFT_2832103 [Lactarius hatsudake]
MLGPERRISTHRFSHPVPAGTPVPQWTLFDITRANIWNATVGRIVGDKVLPGVLINTSSGSGPNTGALAGGVAGGVIAMAVIADLVLSFWRRRRRAQESHVVVDDAQSPPSASQMGQFRPAPSHDTPVPPQTMLNLRCEQGPNNPTTYPQRQEGVLTSTPIPVVSYNGYLNGNNPTNMRPLHLPVQGYHGLPMAKRALDASTLGKGSSDSWPYDNLPFSISVEVLCRLAGKWKVSSSLAAITSFFLLFAGDLVVAQIAAPICNDTLFSWGWRLSWLPSRGVGHSYAGPSREENLEANPCWCNTVAYNLLNACADCQGGLSLSWSEYYLNCTSIRAPSTFGLTLSVAGSLHTDSPTPVPAGTRVPQWVLQDTSRSGIWSYSSARLIGDTPEVFPGELINTPTTFTIMTTTSASSASLTTVPVPTPSSSGSGLYKGALAGDVICGVTAIAAIFLSLFS